MTLVFSQLDFSMNPIVVTGTGGRLGSALSSFITSLGKKVVGLTRKTCDLCQAQDVEEVILSLKPGLIFHSAAMTDVDACELDPERAWRDNHQATVNIAYAACISGTRLVFFSTDYVFDGQKSFPYTEDDKPRPVNVYGETKLAAEEAVIAALKDFVIIRVSWLFGTGMDFVSFILDSAGKGVPLKLGIDHRGSPAYVPDLLNPIMSIASSAETGIFHLTNRGECNRYEMGLEILRLSGLKADPEPSNSHEIGFIARRPPSTPLSISKFESRFNQKMRPWQEALRDYIRGTC